MKSDGETCRLIMEFFGREPNRDACNRVRLEVKRDSVDANSIRDKVPLEIRLDNMDPALDGHAESFAMIDRTSVRRLKL